jgi:hypothetical protein
MVADKTAKGGFDRQDAEDVLGWHAVLLAGALQAGGVAVPELDAGVDMAIV